MASYRVYRSTGYAYHSIERFKRKKVTVFFVEATQRKPSWLPLRILPTMTWKRALAVALVTVLACLLHCVALFWYDSLPAPMPITEAKALPMIDIALEAANAGAEAEIKPEIAKPTLPKPKIKPIKKPKPKPKPEKTRSEIKKPLVKPQEQPVEPESKASGSPIKDLSNRVPVVGTKADSDSKNSQSGKVTAARGYVGYLNNPKPNYPGIAKSRHWEGLVMLRVYVTPDGRCGNLNIYRSSGHEVLDESAMTAVRNWRFVPGKRGDTPIASWATVPIEFRLRD
jgi:periplasmic protein TonB